MIPLPAPHRATAVSQEVRKSGLGRLRRTQRRVVAADKAISGYAALWFVGDGVALMPYNTRWWLEESKLFLARRAVPLFVGVDPGYHKQFRSDHVFVCNRAQYRQLLRGKDLGGRWRE